MATNASASHEGDATNGRIENAIEQLQSIRKKIHQEGEWAENFHWYDDRVDELDDAIGLLESTDDNDDLPEITRHVEAPEYGGETYARCEGCGVESVGGPNHILHDGNCPHSEVRR